MEKGQASDLLQALKDLLANYQKAVRVARHKYFSNVIAKSQHKPAVLFATINDVTIFLRLSMTFNRVQHSTETALLKVLNDILSILWL